MTIKLMVRQTLQELHGRGWSDIAIADALKVTRITVYRWRTGERSPSMMADMVLRECVELLTRTPPGAPDQVAV